MEINVCMSLFYVICRNYETKQQKLRKGYSFELMDISTICQHGIYDLYSINCIIYKYVVYKYTYPYNNDICHY